MQIGSDLFCAIGFVGKNITVLQVWKQLQQRNCLRAIINISGRQQKSHRPQVFSDNGMNFRVQASAPEPGAAQNSKIFFRAPSSRQRQKQLHTV